MPDITVEEAVEQNCQALMAGDVTRVMTDLTPDALANLMAMAGGITAVPSLLGYEVRSHQVQDGNHVFEVAFNTSDGELMATATWKEVDGAWKIVNLAVSGL